MLPFPKFTFNNFKYRATQSSLFENIRPSNPNIVVDVVPISNLTKYNMKGEKNG